ncbi:MAG: hypothetical protein Homavirus36_4 [Homavirus sp.]|uniref:Uncharacterized protein n=1 Tax=Homavirus sp. TaxID=2487769 RepID=A0A3G5AAH5_9VIRU|nr:MAG: hypothetical protein Homavirus36_4 [Homavirus sp.]
MNKYISSANSIIPFYTLNNLVYPNLPIKLPPNITLNHRCELLDTDFMNSYFADIKNGKYFVVSIDNYNTTQYMVSIMCSSCDILIGPSNAYYYCDKKKYCIECGPSEIPNKNELKLQVNHFGSYKCDICNTMILGHMFYHNRKENYDVCIVCADKQTNKQTLINSKKLKLIENNIIDPIGYTFGSLLEWIPILSIIMVDNTLVNKKIVLQHYTLKKYAVCNILPVQLSPYNVTAASYEELKYNNLNSVISMLSEEYHILDTSSDEENDISIDI